MIGRLAYNVLVHINLYLNPLLRIHFLSSPKFLEIFPNSCWGRLPPKFGDEFLFQCGLYSTFCIRARDSSDYATLTGRTLNPTFE